MALSSLYKEPSLLTPMQLTLIGFGLFIFLGLLYFYFRNTKTSSEELNMAMLSEMLPKAEYDILVLIVKQHPAPTPYPDILNYFEPNLTYESRIKKLRVALDNLNDSMKKIYGSHKQYVVSQKNKDDRRVKEVKYVG